MNQAYPALGQLEDDYFLIGSSALALTGINIASADDIDILTTRKNAEQLKLSWSNLLKANYQPEKKLLFRSNFARFDFGSMDIEVMGDLEVKKINRWMPVVVQDYFLYEKDGYQIKIPTLEEQKRILLLFDRSKDKEKLKLINPE